MPTDRPKILIISCVFHPELIVSAVTGYDLAKKLNELNYDTEVITQFPSKTKGKIFKGYKKKFYSIDKNYPFKVLRCWSIFSSKASWSSRFLENITFGISSSIRLIFMKKKPDLIYLNTWPVFATFLNLLIAKIFKIRVLRSVKDLYPETLIENNSIKKNGVVEKIFYFLESINFKYAYKNIVLSEKTKELLLQKYIGIKTIIVIKDWNNFEHLKDKFQEPNIDRSKLISKKILVFGGNISVAANVEMIIKAFSKLFAKDNNYLLVVAGNGSQLNNCINLCKTLGLQIGTDIIFYREWPKEETLSLLSLADLLILPTSKNQALYSVPSKIYSYMFSGKPILALGIKDSELGVIIEDSKCGWILESDDPNTISNEIIDIFQYKIGDKNHIFDGVKYLEQEFSRNNNLNKYIELIEGLL